MDKMREVVQQIPGHFYIEGHTDDLPIHTPQYRSNWELSSSRAVSVAHELFKDDSIPRQRFTVVGHGDTKPLVPNTDRLSRAKNRRVEIIIEQKSETAPEDTSLYEAEQFQDHAEDISNQIMTDKVQEQIDQFVDPQAIEDIIRETEEKETPQVFEFSPDEIF
ncbi:MAG: OmpA family protein, partial [Gammaproteobacteria bacterium]